MQLLLGPPAGECMRGLGFRYEETYPPAPAAEMPIRALLERRYLTPRLDEAGAVIGYVNPENDAQPPLVDATIDQTHEAHEAFFGEQVASRSIPDANGSPRAIINVGDGCWGQAISDAFGSPNAYLDVMADQSVGDIYLAESYSRLRSDPEYLALSQRWAACMAAQGYTYELIFDPANSDWESPRPSAAERQVATVDAECRHSTGADIDHLEAIETAIQQGIIEEKPDLIPSIERARQTVYDLLERE